MNGARVRADLSMNANAFGRIRPRFVTSLVALAACAGVVTGCSTDNAGTDNNDAGMTGVSASGGKASGAAGKGTSSGGMPSTGTGGAPATGGTSGSAGTSSPMGAGGATAKGGAGGSAGSVVAAGQGGTSSAGMSGSGGMPAASGGGGMSAAGGAAAGAPAAGAGGTDPTYVEDQSADCQIGTLPESSTLTKQIPKLPDPFTRADGTRVATKAEWHCRREEIRKQAEKYVFGAKPGPETTTGKVTDTKIDVHVAASNGKMIDFSVKVTLPSTGQKPFPVLINVGTTNTLTDKRILDQGVAVITYDNYQLGKEGTAEMSRGKPNPGKFYDIYGGDNEAGLLTSWAWGASRLLDVIEQTGATTFDIHGIGVTGCSRWGKGAFVIGFMDDRIALTMPQEPSTGGDPAFRIVDKISGAERTDYNYNGLNWLSDNFAPFVYANNVSNVVKLPIDTHAMIAAMAPRGILILENPHQTQMGAPAGHIAAMAGLEVYKALGVEKNLSYHSDVSDTAHCSYKNEYTDLIAKSMTAFLKHQGDPPGEIHVGADGKLNPSDWIDWTAPTLQ